MTQPFLYRYLGFLATEIEPWQKDGEDWRRLLSAAEDVSRELGVPIRGYGVGLREEYNDVFGEWTRMRDIRDHGCLLIRTDRFIVWRSHPGVSDPTGTLRSVMRKILNRPID